MVTNTSTKKHIARIKKNCAAFSRMNGKQVRLEKVWFEAKVVCHTFNIPASCLERFRKNNSLPHARIGKEFYYRIFAKNGSPYPILFSGKEGAL